MWMCRTNFSFQNVFHQLMISLSCMDLLYLIFSDVCFSLPKMSTDYRLGVFVHLVPYAMPVAQMFLSGSCYSTVALTIERYNY